MTSASPQVTAGAPHARVRAARLRLAVAVFFTEIIAAKFAIGSFVISTIPQDHQGAVLSEHFLMLCALPLLAAAGTYWTIGRSPTSGVLLAIAAVGTTFGLYAWLVTIPLVLIAIVQPISKDPLL